MTVFHEGGSVSLAAIQVEAAMLGVATMALLEHHGMPGDLQLVPADQGNEPHDIPLTHFAGNDDHYRPAFHAVRKADQYGITATMPSVPGVGRNGLVKISYGLQQPPEGYSGWPIRVDEMETGPQGADRALGLTIDGLARALRQISTGVILLPGYQWQAKHSVGAGRL